MTTPTLKTIPVGSWRWVMDLGLAEVIPHSFRMRDEHEEVYRTQIPPRWVTALWRGWFFQSGGKFEPKGTRWRELLLVVMHDRELQKTLEVLGGIYPLKGKAYTTLRTVKDPVARYAIEVYEEFARRLIEDAPAARKLAKRQRAREMRIRGALTGGTGAQPNGDPIPRPTDDAFLAEATLTPQKKRTRTDA